jgi:hypothetical protein
VNCPNEYGSRAVVRSFFRLGADISVITNLRQIERVKAANSATVAVVIEHAPWPYRPLRNNQSVSGGISFQYQQPCMSAGRDESQVICIPVVG